VSGQSGELPLGWALAELCALSERRGGGTPSRSVKRYFQGNIPWVTVADLPPIGAAPPTILASREAITDQAIAASSAKPIPKDSVVFATRVSIGKVAIAGCTLATNQDFRSLLPGSAHEPSYIAWFLSHIAQFNLPANQGTTIKGITTSKFDGIQVPLPPLAEQQRIVAKIEALQEKSRRAREALSEVGPLLEQFRQSVLAAVFRGDLTADWRATHPNVEPASQLLHRIRAERRRRWEQAELAKYETKGKEPPMNWKDRYKEPEPANDSVLPELPAGWCWCALEQLAVHMSGFAFESKHFTKKGIQVVKLGNLYQAQFDLTRDPSYVSLDHPNVDAAPVYKGDILVSQTGTRHKKDYGHFVMVPECSKPLVLNQRVLAVRSVEPELSKWIIYASRLEPYRSHFFSHETGGVNQGNVGIAGVMRGPVPLAPAEEIFEIIRRLALADEMVENVEQLGLNQLKALNDFDQSILVKAFRGELVPQDPNDEPASVLLERIRAQRAQQTKGPKQTSKSHQTSKLGKKSSRLEPQQLTLEEVLRSAD
jgi:type I restriction enzyme S subunit